MESDVYPKYRPILSYNISADAHFLTSPTVETDKIHIHTDSKTCSCVTLDISSALHPVYTGGQRKTRSEGRVARPNKRSAGFVGGKGA